MHQLLTHLSQLNLTNSTRDKYYSTTWLSTKGTFKIQITLNIVRKLMHYIIYRHHSCQTWNTPLFDSRTFTATLRDNQSRAKLTQLSKHKHLPLPLHPAISYAFPSPSSYPASFGHPCGWDELLCFQADRRTLKTLPCPTQYYAALSGMHRAEESQMVSMMMEFETFKQHLQ